MEDMAAFYSHYQHPPPPPGAAPAPTLAPLAYVPPHPAPYSHALPCPSYASNDQVRTLFVAGLPEDVKPREIYNLFREFPGYESSHLRSSDKDFKPFAFAVFSDQQSAIAAMHALNGMVFDLEKLSTLHIALAKSNPRSKRTRMDDEREHSKKARASSTTSDPGFGSFHMPGMSNSAHNTNGYPPAQSHGYAGSDGVNETAAAKSNTPAAPCPTLFVANLGPNCTEKELIQLFSGCRGFLKLKMQSTYGTPVAFVDFQDIECSSEALHSLQSTVLHSSPAGEAMRLQYARSRMGMRKKGR